MIKACDLRAENLWAPPAEGKKAVQRRPGLKAPGRRPSVDYRTEAPLKETAFGASDRAATMSGHPSPSRSPIATP